jgi:hypothetical protein
MRSVFVRQSSAPKHASGYRLFWPVDSTATWGGSLPAPINVPILAHCGQKRGQ